MSVIDDYLMKLSEVERGELEKIRKVVHETVPEAEEVISYGMPGFKYQGKYLCGFNAFKGHLSFFPTGTPIEELKDKLSGFKLARGTIQFNIDQPIPEPIIKKLVLIRATAINDN